MLEEIKDDLNKWKDSLCSWIGRLNIIDDNTCHSRFSAISTKIPMAIFVEMEKSILKSIWNSKETQIAKTILKKNHKMEISHFLISKFTTKLQYSNCIVLHRDRCEYRIESLEINPHIYGQLFLTRLPRLFMDSLFNKWCWENWITTYEINWIFTLHCRKKLTQNGSNLRAEAIKLLEENTGKNIHDTGSLNYGTKSTGKKDNYINWTSSKLTFFWHQKTLSREWKDNPKNGRKYVLIIHLTRV